MSKRFYITTAIDYTNAAPHIGHAYEKVLADVIARYRRLRDGDAYFLTGVDQHGQKVKQSAEAAGIEPKEFADQVTEKFLALWKSLDIRYDDWAATTDPRHKKAVQKILSDLHAQGQLYKATHAGFYSVRQEQFLTDKERDAEGNFGSEWGEVVEIEEENWYFKLSEHRQWLADFLGKTPGFITPSFRQVETIRAVEKLTGDLCISRPKARLSWGIELPFDPDYVTYVWFDALINYISFVGYASDGDASLPDFDTLWPCDFHVIGKDILVPAHGVYWPIMLHALGIPDERMPRLLVHGWWNLGGAKISKSTGTIIDPAQLKETYGADALRYYLMRDIATGQDADYNESRLQQRYNADLANDLGNLLNRSLNMISRYREGVVRKVEFTNPEINALEQLGKASLAKYTSAMDSCEIHLAMEAVWLWISACNAFVETSAPWKLAKDDSSRDHLDAVLYTLVSALRRIAVLVSPVIPSAADQILNQLQSPIAPDTLLAGLFAEQIPDGHTIGAPVPVFPRLEIADAQQNA